LNDSLKIIFKKAVKQQGKKNLNAPTTAVQLPDIQ